MAQDNYALLTRTGRLKEAQRMAGQSVPAITHMAFGDADRSPTGGETALGHEVHRAALTGYGIEPGQTAAFFDCYVPAAIGGFVVREIGLFDAAGDLIAIGRRSPGLPKVAPENGGGDDLTFRMDVFFDDLETLVVQVSPIAGLTADNLDLYLHANNLPVEAVLSSAPGAPIERGQWLIAPNPSGIWAGKVNQIARYRGGVWRYETPRAGRVVTYWSGSRQVVLRFDGTAWAEDLATTDAAGRVELATVAEALTGTSTTLAVTPAGLAKGTAALKTAIFSRMTAGAFEVTVPEGAAQADVTLWGGGGGGGGVGSAGNGSAGGGGAGGASRHTISVTPGAKLSGTIGAGGTGGAQGGAGADGGSSAFAGSVAATGGKGGKANPTGDGGAGGVGTTGTILVKGGDGTAGSSGNASGGPGGTASLGGGGGGGGGYGLGGPGASPGGGGGASGGAQSNPGGNGADGGIIIRWQ